MSSGDMTVAEAMSMEDMDSLIEGMAALMRRVEALERSQQGRHECSAGEAEEEPTPTLMATIARLEKERDDLKAELARWKRRSGVADDQIERLQCHLDHFIELARRLTDERDQLRWLAETLDRDAELDSDKLADCREAVVRLTEERDEARKVVALRESQIAYANRGHATARKELHEARKALEALRARYERAVGVPVKVSVTTQPSSAPCSGRARVVDEMGQPIYDASGRAIEADIPPI